MTVHATLEDGLALVTLDDGKVNAINEILLRGINRALDTAEDANAIVLLGRPSVFCAGLDLKTLPTLEADDLRRVLIQFKDTVLRLFTFPKPVVVATQGHAVAGGMVLMLGADERWAADGSYRLGLTETNLGITLPRFVVEMARTQIAPNQLHRLLVCGERFDPSEAQTHGLVDHIRSPAELISAASSRAKELGALSSAYGRNKALLREEAAQRGDRAFEEEIKTLMATILDARR